MDEYIDSPAEDDIEAFRDVALEENRLPLPQLLVIHLRATLLMQLQLHVAAFLVELAEELHLRCGSDQHLVLLVDTINRKHAHQLQRKLEFLGVVVRLRQSQAELFVA
jgi:hypothetical protein